MPTRPDTSESEQAVAVGPEQILPVERRRHERLSVSLKVRWECLLGSHEGTLGDISAGGCFILTDGHVKLREFVRLEIQLHTGEWMKVWGTVSNCFPPVGFGVTYTDADDEGQNDRIAVTLEQTKLIRAAVAALKRLDDAAVKRKHGDGGVILMGLREYKAKLLLALPHVNRALLALPDCQKKTALTLAVRAYVDAGRIWATMTEVAAADAKARAAAYHSLKKTHEAPKEVMEALIKGNFPPVLQFLWQKGYICLTFVS